MRPGAESITSARSRGSKHNYRVKLKLQNMPYHSQSPEKQSQLKTIAKKQSVFENLN